MLRPNRPFDLHAMLELGDDAMQEWCDAVCNAFSRYKVVKGSLYRYQPRPRKVVEAAAARVSSATKLHLPTTMS